jgi:hypothetical protein
MKKGMVWQRGGGPFSFTLMTRGAEQPANVPLNRRFMAVKAPGLGVLSLLSLSPSQNGLTTRLATPDKPELPPSIAAPTASPSSGRNRGLSSSARPEPEAPPAETELEPDKARGPKPKAPAKPGPATLGGADAAAAQESAESSATAVAAAAVSFAGPVVGVVPPRLAPEPCSLAAERSATPPCQEEEVFLKPALGNRARQSGEKAKERAKDSAERRAGGRRHTRLVWWC